MDNQILVENIRALCKKNNVSITKLETNLFLSPGLISRWAKSSPAFDKIMDIADYFGVSIDELVGRSQQDVNNMHAGQLLISLYNRTLSGELEWNILNFQAPPENLESLSPRSFHSPEHCDCYYANYLAGFFFLISSYAEDGALCLALFTLPDVHSRPERICTDTPGLKRLHNYLQRRLAIQLNRIKTINFIDSFLQSDTGDSTATENPEPISNVIEVSNF